MPPKKPGARQREPLMESVDYTDFVARQVRREIARRRAKADERLLYAAQDMEDWLLDIGTRVDALTAQQLAAAGREIRRRTTA